MAEYESGCLRECGLLAKNLWRSALLAHTLSIMLKYNVKGFRVTCPVCGQVARVLSLISVISAASVMKGSLGLL
jgi:hypothetical protein